MIYISDSFRLSMLDREVQREYNPRAIEHARIPRPMGRRNVMRQLKNFESLSAQIVSLIRDPDAAIVLSRLLERDLPVNRESVVLGQHDLLYVGEYVGDPLPEGAAEFFRGTEIDWWVI